MTIEEKAGAYDEAIDKVGHFIKKYIGLGCMIHPNSSEAKELFDIFPELKESEDERIKKALIDYFDDANKADENPLQNYGIHTDKVTAWLKKQGQSRKITHEEICKSYGISDIGEFSDGYHTFNSLYKQRMILFAVLVKTYKSKAWKSWKHEDGLDCFGGGWFIVGIDTPAGTYTYHYEAKDWDKFDCKILDKAKHWDGHDDSDVERLFSLLENQGDSIEVNPTEFDSQLNRLLKQFESLPKKELVSSLSFYLSVVQNEQKFYEGDWVVRGDTIAQILDVQDQYYVGIDTNGKDFTSSRFLSDNKIHLWTIKDAKPGDVLVTPNQSIFIFKDIKGATVYDYCGLYSNRFWNKPSAVNGTLATELPKDYVPATKEQCDLLFKKMHELGYEWSNKDKTLTWTNNFEYLNY